MSNPVIESVIIDDPIVDENWVMLESIMKIEKTAHSLYFDDSDHEGIVKSLLNKNAEMNAQDRFYDNALHAK